MLDEIRPSTSSEFDDVWAFYADVCAQMPHDRYNPQWKLGIFPSQERVMGLMADEALLIGIYQGKIGAAYALIPHDDEEYRGIAWPSGAQADEVSVIGLLAVHPSSRGKGVGAELVQDAIARSREMGKGVIRLDVVADNLAASRIYRAAGFEYVADYEDYYERTGRMVFELYELTL